MHRSLQASSWFSLPASMSGTLRLTARSQAAFPSSFGSSLSAGGSTVKIVRSTTTNPAGSPNVRVKPAGKPDEFRRFEDLTRKLAQVPKSELDDKRKTQA